MLVYLHLGERRETANSREIITTFFFKKRRLKADFKTYKMFKQL